MSYKGTIIIACLESYEIVRRQILWFNKWMPAFRQWQFLLVDDGSEPPIKVEHTTFPFRIIQTNDKRPWTQPRARNIAASHADSEWLLFTDIDHILTPEAVEAVDKYDGDKIHFARKHGALDEDGNLLTDYDSMVAYGLKQDKYGRVDEHYNTFGIRKSVFDGMIVPGQDLPGYDDRFCGKYGGDDTDFSARYAEAHYAGKCKRSKGRAATIYVFPEPKWDRLQMFHSLRRQGFH